MNDPHATPPPAVPPSEPPPGSAAPPVVPASSPPAAAPPRPPRRGRSLLGLFFGASLAFNMLAIFLVVLLLIGLSLSGLFASKSADSLEEEFHSGKHSASDKVAIIKMDGVIVEGLMGYPHKEVEQAAKDKHVKAVVLRINSPGGSITASDELHRRLIDLRDGKDGHPGKPIVVSMGSLAASGGYYIAMPGKPIYAERTTLTGSIGVFASFPNVKELGDRYGFKMNTIKAGRIKDSGSPFSEMTPEERYVWQDMVNQAYGQFLKVVEAGRPDLKNKLEDFVIDREVTVQVPEDVKEGDKVMRKTVEKKVRYRRQRADGGIWTADKAKEFGLIDDIGYLDDAVKAAAKQAGLGDKYRAITYEKPKSLADVLLGVKSPAPAVQLDAAALSNSLTPRLWYLAPQSELAGLTATLGR